MNGHTNEHIETAIEESFGQPGPGDAPVATRPPDAPPVEGPELTAAFTPRQLAFMALLAALTLTALRRLRRRRRRER